MPKWVISWTLSWIKSDHIFQDQAVTAVNEIRSASVDKAKDSIEKGFNEVKSFAVNKAKDEIAKGMEEVRSSAVELLKKWMEEKLDSTFAKEGFLQLATISSNICTLNAASQLMAVGEGRDRNGIFWKP